MCTIVALHRVHPDAPLIIAANRDEALERPSTPPVVLRDARPRVVAGLDGVKGGTWMGLNDEGLFVGLTNQAAAGPADPSLRSRGEVVKTLLEQPSLEAARAWIDGIDPSAYNPFNLFAGDGEHLEVVYARPDSLRREGLPAGMHVLPNDVLGSPRFPKVQRVEALLDPNALAQLSLAEVERRMVAALGDHHEPEAGIEVAGAARFDPSIARRLQALCIHMPFYGTCSASFIATAHGRPLIYRFADGKPCVTPFIDVLPGLDVGGGLSAGEAPR